MKRTFTFLFFFTWFSYTYNIFVLIHTVHGVSFRHLLVKSLNDNASILQESVATKYRPGACENCGAMTHKKKDCMERPRKIGVKFNNTSIAADEFVQPVLHQSYDGKRDRWAGYDPSEHKRIIEQYQRVEEAKRQLRSDKLDTGDAISEEVINKISPINF